MTSLTDQSRNDVKFLSLPPSIVKANVLPQNMRSHLYSPVKFLRIRHVNFSRQISRMQSSNQINLKIVRVVSMVIIIRNDSRESVLAVRPICNRFCLHFNLHEFVLGKQNSERKIDALQCWKCKKCS